MSIHFLVTCFLESSPVLGGSTCLTPAPDPIN